jgi:hypothetical protein
MPLRRKQGKQQKLKYKKTILLFLFRLFVRSIWIPVTPVSLKSLCFSPVCVDYGFAWTRSSAFFFCFDEASFFILFEQFLRCRSSLLSRVEPMFYSSVSYDLVKRFSRRTSQLSSQPCSQRNRLPIAMVDLPLRKCRVILLLLLLRKRQVLLLLLHHWW